jgi:adenylosuccinate synthase
MPISIVVGGQYGSEGKGKVALEMVRRDPSTTIVVRPGGTNSGHTGYTREGKRIVLRQLPAGAIDGAVKVVFPAGSYIDVDLLLKEMEELTFPPSQILVDPRAHLIRPEHIEWEKDADLVRTIGSTGSGTGAAVVSRVTRYASQHPLGLAAADNDVLAPYLAETGAIMADALAAGERILIEGTQGFGLSLFHADCWPKCTSRDTTAAGFLSEAGLSPLNVDRIFLVLRCHPIRVAGDSGPLPQETTWEAIAEAAGIEADLRELTSVTQKLRRVGLFDSTIVRRAIRANSPTDVILNHLDYVDRSNGADLSPKAVAFVKTVEDRIGRNIDWIGMGPLSIEPAGAVASYSCSSR